MEPGYQINSIETLVCATWHAGRGAEMDSRPNCGFVICDESEFVFFSESGEHIADKNHLLVLPRGAKYNFECKKGGVTYTYNFQGSVPHTEPYEIPLPEDSKCLQYAREIQSEESEYARLGLMYMLLGDALRGGVRKSVPTLIRPQLDYIRAFFDDSEMTNSSLAAMTNISEIYFRKLFTQAIGTSPHEYVTALRLERAKTLLSGGEGVSETARKCGFSSLYYFSAAFKRRVGVSPSDYARAYGKI